MILTCFENTAISSLNDSEEHTSPPATPGSRGVHVASSHFSKIRARRGNRGCLKQKTSPLKIISGNTSQSTNCPSLSYSHTCLSTVKTKRPFHGVLYLVLGVKLKRGYVFWLFFKIDLCSATSMESSRRDLLNDMPKHRSTIKK